MTASMHLAEVNVALARAPLDSPVMAGFLKVFGDVNWLAEQSPGFVWRLLPQHGPVTLGTLGDDDVIVTLSVWKDFASLQQYVYRSGHALFMGRRSKWFVPIGGFTTAMWWIEEGERPAVEDGLARLRRLREHGPTPDAFALRRQFDPQGVPVR